MDCNRRLIARLGLAFSLIISMLGFLAPTGSVAASVDHEERSQSDPTGWWWYYGQSEAQVNTLITNNQARLVDIEVESTAPYRFTVAMVSNQGAYAKGWGWWYGQSAESLSQKISDSNARIIDLETNYINGQRVYAAILVQNTGDENKAWWWYLGRTVQQVSDLLSQNQARLIDIEPVNINGTISYDVVMVQNTGSNNKGWWWYINRTPAQVSDLLGQNNARLIDLERHAEGTYDIIMEACPCNYWWYYYNRTASQVNDLVAQNGARLVSVESYLVAGSRFFNIVMINNSNAITSRVGHLLRSNTDGASGLYLKRVGGGVLAALQPDRQFEPASTIKVLPHLYALRDVQSGAASLNDSVPIYTDVANTSCPGDDNGSTETLQTALREMMWHSDNERTKAVINEFGRANINALAQNIGMASTSINHTIGCGSEAVANPDRLTLADAGRLYEGVANGSLLNAANRNTFYNLMAGRGQFQVEGYDWTGLWSSDIPAMIDQEAPGGMSEALKTSFRNQMRLAYKAGSYGLNGLTYLSIAGWAQVPFCNSAVMAPRQYVFGIFIDGASNSTGAGNAFGATKAELLREQIRAGLGTWGTCNRQVYVPPGTVGFSYSDTSLGVEVQPQPAMIPDTGLVIDLAAAAPLADPAGIKPAGTPFDLKFYDAANGNQLDKLPASYQLVLTYTDQQLAQAGITDEARLRLYYLDGTTWKLAGSDALDTTNNRITTTLDHASSFTLGISTSQPIYLPSIMR